MKHLKYLAATVLLSIGLPSFAKVGTRPAASLEKNKTEALLVELTGKDITKEDDRTLYSEMIAASEASDEISFKSRLQSLLTRFPHSPYADNALFLAGRRAVDAGHFAEAIRYFGRIEREYPRSNRVVAARFAKAMTYKKMNLPEFARQSLVDLKSQFPGSPESFRADSELNLMR